MRKIFVIVSSSGKVNTAGLQHESDVIEVKKFVRDAFQQMVPRVSTDTEVSPLHRPRRPYTASGIGDPRLPAYDAYEHDRRKLVETSDVRQGRRVKQFNISKLAVLSNKRKEKLRAGIEAREGFYPSLSFFIDKVRNFVRMYGSDEAQLVSFFNLRPPFPVGETVLGGR